MDTLSDSVMVPSSEEVSEICMHLYLILNYLLPNYVNMPLNYAVIIMVKKMTVFGLKMNIFLQYVIVCTVQNRLFIVTSGFPHLHHGAGIRYR